MAAIPSLSTAEEDFLAPSLPPSHPDRNDLPFVTLTYAQSLDGMIASAPGVRTTLSGPETKSMTHYLRLKHDAILIGVGTAKADDPSLNCRYPSADLTLDHQPRPIIIDPNLTWDVRRSKVLQLASEGKGKWPWIVHSSSDHGQVDEHVNADVAESRPSSSEQRIYIKAHVSKAQGERHDSIPWPAILSELKARGAQSVMIEGGATVIRQFLQQPNLVNSAIVTIAPMWLGSSGVLAAPHSDGEGDGQDPVRMRQTVWRQFGVDVVGCGRLNAG